MMLRHFAFLFFLLVMASSVWAASSACGAPASWEAHKTYSDLALEGILVLAAVGVLGLGFLNKQQLLMVGGLVIAVVAVGHFVLGPPLNLELVGFGLPGSTHQHADFSVYINDVPQNFSMDKYGRWNRGEKCACI